LGFRSFSVVPKSVNLTGVWLVLAAVNGPVAFVPRRTVYPVGVGPVSAAAHDTNTFPLVGSLGSEIAATLIGTNGGAHFGWAETSLELGEVQPPLLTVTT
jgi:hypothetical protein